VKKKAREKSFSLFTKKRQQRIQKKKRGGLCMAGQTTQAGQRTKVTGRGKRVNFSLQEKTTFSIVLS